ncbi:MAG TPA: protein phosphatase 2C domain-containing protein, partial [Pyrinomonadaceae bacterium]|nr:protein phosphatase 2C domain-containing protein [Pyrinomonadaceae bacterium]
VTHPGYVRANNEDHYLVVRFGRSLQNVCTNLEPSLLASSYDLTGYGLLVADGVGGMAAGEVASQKALAKLVELVVDTPDWILGFQEKEHSTLIQQRMTARFLQIDEALKERADHDVALSGMGTTLTAAAILGNDMVIGHIGDSRAYLLRNDILTQLTKDHTVAQELLDAGISSADPRYRSMRHVLTAALGSLGSRIQPEVQQLKLNPHDQLLLCTDGLTQMVDDRTIASVLRNSQTADEVCKNLITLALAAGGLDNVTVVLARLALRGAFG